MGSPLPTPLAELVGHLSKLPGLGPKSAMRAAMALLKWPENDTRRLGEEIFALRDKLRLCSRCGSLSSDDPCRICSDETRDKNLLCVVPEWDSLLALEEGLFYDGLYFVLGGLLAPPEREGASGPDLQALKERLAGGDVKEVILALGATLEGENTATWISRALKKDFPSVRISRLAQGMPLGAEVRFMDKETLRQSLRYRQEI